MRVNRLQNLPLPLSTIVGKAYAGVRTELRLVGETKLEDSRTTGAGKRMHGSSKSKRGHLRQRGCVV